MMNPLDDESYPGFPMQTQSFLYHSCNTDFCLPSILFIYTIIVLAAAWLTLLLSSQLHPFLVLVSFIQPGSSSTEITPPQYDEPNKNDKHMSELYATTTNHSFLIPFSHTNISPSPGYAIFGLAVTDFRRPGFKCQSARTAHRSSYTKVSLFLARVYTVF